jgi:MSHA pilin protein MshD
VRRRAESGARPPRPVRAGRAQLRCALGSTLVELVVAIVVLGVAATAALGALSRHAVGAPDALQVLQATAVAQALLDEALAQGTGTVDPDGVANGPGPEPGEARSSAVAPFDHVDDYDGYAMEAGIVAFDGEPVPGLEGYRLRMTATSQSIADLPASQAWWVRVQVDTPSGASVVLEGLRARLDE